MSAERTQALGPSDTVIMVSRGPLFVASMLGVVSVCACAVMCCTAAFALEAEREAEARALNAEKVAVEALSSRDKGQRELDRCEAKIERTDQMFEAAVAAKRAGNVLLPTGTGGASR